MKWFYLITPLFVVMDLGLGWDFRVAGLREWDDRLLYYVFCGVIAFLQWKKPNWEAVTTLVDSVINYAILIIATYRQYVLWPSAMGSPDGYEPMGYMVLINFLLVGLMLIVSFHSAMRRLHAR